MKNDHNKMYSFQVPKGVSNIDGKIICAAYEKNIYVKDTGTSLEYLYFLLRFSGIQYIIFLSEIFKTQ